MNFNFFVNIITIFIAIIILKIYFSIFFEKQKAHEYNPFFWIIYLIWQLFFMNCASISSSFKLTLNIILVIFICLYYFIGNIFSKIIVSVLICSIWTIQEFLIGAFFLLINLNIINLSFVGSVLSKVLTLLLVIILRQFFSNEKVQNIPSKYYILITLIPAGSLYIMYNIFYLCGQSNQKSVLGISIISFLIILVMNLVIFKVYILLAQEFEIKHQNTIYIQQLKAFEKSNTEREQMYSTFRKMQHDFKHHYSILTKLLIENQYEKAKEYMNSLDLVPTLSNTTISKTGNIILDSLINSKFAAIQNKAFINLFIDVNVPPVLPFQAADLGILFGNIIDNAIEAVLPNSDSSNTIKLLARYEKETLIVTCINSYKGKLIFNPSGELITSKSDSTNHGYGIYSIKKVATKYHESVSIDFNNSMFTIKVLLCNF